MLEVGRYLLFSEKTFLCYPELVFSTDKPNRSPSRLARSSKRLDSKTNVEKLICGYFSTSSSIVSIVTLSQRISPKYPKFLHARGIILTPLSVTSWHQPTSKASREGQYLAMSSKPVEKRNYFKENAFVLFVLRFYGQVNSFRVMSILVSLPNYTFPGQT